MQFVSFESLATAGRAATRARRLPADRRWSPGLPAVLGTLALVGLLVAGAALAAGGAQQRLVWFVPAVRANPFPDWLAGPLHGLGLGLAPRGGAALLVLMAVCYLVVLACARAIAPSLVLGVVLLLHVAFLLAPPLFSADVFGYVDYARLHVVHGLDPYLHGAAAAPHDPAAEWVRWHDVATPYGPLFTVLSSPLAWMSVPAALWICKSLAALLSLACLALVWRIAQRREVAPAGAVAFVGLNPLLLAYGVGGAHNDFLWLALGLLGVLLTLERRSAAGGFAGALALGVKASSGLLLPFVLLGAHRRRRAFGGALAAGALVLLVGVAAFGGEALGFLKQLRQQQDLVATYSVPSRVAAALGFDGIPSGLRLLVAVAFLVTVVLLLWRTWQRRLDWLAAAGWATLALLLSTAWLVPWYVVWLLPLAAVGRDRRLTAATLLFCGYVLATRVAYQFV
jgi:Glycosyltransferase family 87